jgi:hypothetical protein
MRYATALIAPGLLPLFLSVCAEIPADRMPDPVDEYAPVTVEIEGDGNAEVYPSRAFDVLVGGGATVSINAGLETNTRIAWIRVGGEEVCCGGDTVVREAAVAVPGVSGGIAVAVGLAKIDAVWPVAEIVSPAATDAFAATVPLCLFGAIEYTLNKSMAGGYIKWRSEDADGATNNDSLQTVRIPEDITGDSHDIGAWSYASPDGYLSEGLQKFDLAVSPVAGKRVTRGEIGVPRAYSFVIQFTDSLGNESAKALRRVWVISSGPGCP